MKATPEAISEAPPAVRPPASLYLQSVATVLSDLDQGGLDPKRVGGATVVSILVDPAVKSAGAQVAAYAQTQCHFSISG